MEDINKIYALCVKRNAELLRNMKIEADAEEFVNQAWLDLSLSKEKITIKSISDKAKDLVYNRLRSHIRPQSKCTTQFCKRCMQDLPMGCFGLYFRKIFNRKVPQSWCKECMNKYLVDCRKAGKYNWVQLLPDSYVSWNLRKRGVRGTITKEMIEKNRLEILEKRSKKCNPKSDLKRCGNCELELSLENFSLRTDRGTGRNINARASYCKACMREISKKYYYKRLQLDSSRLSSTGLSFADSIN